MRNSNSDNRQKLPHVPSVKLVLITCFLSSLGYLLALNLDDTQVIDTLNNILPTLLLIACALNVILLLKQNSLFIFLPILWFFEACGQAYGLGPLIYSYGSDAAVHYANQLYYVHQIDLLQTNLLNSIGIFIVCASFCLTTHCFKPHIFKQSLGNRYDDDKILDITFRFLFISLPIKLFIITPQTLGFVDWHLPSVLVSFGNMTWLCLFMLFYLRAKGKKSLNKICFPLLIVEMVLAIPTLSKGALLSPPLFAFLGTFFATRKLRVLVCGFFFLLIAFSLLAPFMNQLRDTVSKNEGITAQEKLELIWEYSSGERIISTPETTPLESIWLRNCFTNVQAFLMDRYNSGLPGNSIKGLWIAVIPRVFWPDKPITTDVGVDLNELVMRTRTSSLASTFFGDAYLERRMAHGLYFEHLFRHSLQHTDILGLRSPGQFGLAISANSFRCKQFGVFY